MKSLLLIFLLFSSLFEDPLREVQDIKLMIPTRQQDIFMDYANDNFSQKLVYGKQLIYAEIKSSNFLKLNLNFRLIPDEKKIAALDGDTREVVKDLLGKSQSLKSYLINLSFFLKGNINYSDARLPQDTQAVLLNKKATCVGYSNVVKSFLDSVGIKNKLIKGFYLKEDNGTGSILTPIPHRWVEIYLPNGTKFFYDPQYQKFSANYIATRPNVDFKKVRRFKIDVIRKSRKIMN
jgi:transglutaminase-like putative cysteine protease